MKGFSVAIATALVFATAAFGGSINFETGAGCAFDTSTPLTNTYSGQGITFSGPSSGNGGAILDQCSDFGVSAHSGSDFLAFNVDATMANTGTPIGPETITFSSPVSNVSIFVGGVTDGSGYTMLAFNSGSTEIGNTSGTPTGGEWLQLSIDVSNISSLQLSFTGNTAVFDDLSWDGTLVTSVPEPATLGFCGMALLAANGIRRFRRTRA